MRIKTLVVKAIGVVMAVAGGLLVGTEGPMVHIGAGIAAGVSQGKSTSLKFLNFNIFRHFRTDSEKRVRAQSTILVHAEDLFMSCALTVLSGICCIIRTGRGSIMDSESTSVACASFNLLYLIDYLQGASFWNQVMMWRIMVASFAATLALNVLLSGAEEGLWSKAWHMHRCGRIIRD
jgi:chloride channel 7